MNPSKNWEPKQDTKNGFTVWMGFKERRKERKGAGSTDQTGRRGTSSPFSVPSISPMISAEDRSSVASQAIGCRLRLESGCTAWTGKGSGGGATELKFQ